MNVKTKVSMLTTFGFCVALLDAGHALAAPQGRAADLVASVIEKADTDGDGRISRNEYISAHKKRFDYLDSNKDGYLDMEERQQHRQKVTDHVKDRVKQRSESKRSADQ